MSRHTRHIALSASAALVVGLLLRLWFIHYLPVIAGDSLTYGDIAKNWLQHGIYGFTKTDSAPGSLEIRPTLIRLPGYPLFLAVCFRIFGILNFTAVMYVQAVADLVTCCLAAATARRLFGTRAGILTLWISALCPFTANFVAIPLTETLVLLTIAAAIYGFLRWQLAGCGYNIWLWLTSTALAYSILLRPEQGLFAIAILGAMLAISIRIHTPTRTQSACHRALPIVGAALCIALPFVAWTIRNQRSMHVFQPFAPRYANDPGERAPLGFARWYRTWAIDFIDTENVYWNLGNDSIAFTDLPTRAFTAGSPAATQSERERTAQLLADYNASLAHSTDVIPLFDARFDALAVERIRQHPVLYYVALPIARVANMTFRPRVDMMPMALDWWAWRSHRAQTALAVAYGALNLAYISLGLVGLNAWRRKRWLASSPQSPTSHFRELAFAMAASILLRAALLLTIDNSEPRYTLEFFPILFIWSAAIFAPLQPSNTLAEEARDN